MHDRGGSGRILRQAQDEALCMSAVKEALILSLSKDEGRAAARTLTQ